MRLLAPLVMLLALLFGQAHDAFAHVHTFVHQHEASVPHPEVSDSHLGKTDAGEHSHTIGGHQDRCEARTAASPVQPDAPAVMPQQPRIEIPALPVARSTRFVARSEHLPNAPPPERPSRAPPSVRV